MRPIVYVRLLAAIAVIVMSGCAAVAPATHTFADGAVIPYRPFPTHAQINEARLQSLRGQLQVLADQARALEVPCEVLTTELCVDLAIDLPIIRKSIDKLEVTLRRITMERDAKDDLLDEAGVAANQASWRINLLADTVLERPSIGVDVDASNFEARVRQWKRDVAYLAGVVPAVRAYCERQLDEPLAYHARLVELCAESKTDENVLRSHEATRTRQLQTLAALDPQTIHEHQNELERFQAELDRDFRRASVVLWMESGCFGVLPYPE